MKTATVIFLLLGSLLTTLSHCQEQASPASSWDYPDDTKAICKQWPQKPYGALGVPEGTLAATTDYCEPGFIIRRPTMPGYWQIESVLKLYYKGKLFAVYGGGTCLDENKQDASCVQVFVVYDPDGHGKLTEVGSALNKNNQIEFHMPEWVLK
jgi:hypothetical protein